MRKKHKADLDTPCLILDMDILEGNLAKMQTAARHCGKNLRPSLGVLLDVDVGLHRTGVRPDQAPALADRIISSPHLRLQGLQAYAGQVQHIKTYDERKQVSLQCLQETVRIFRRLRSITPSCTIFSTSGTGTYDIDSAVEEITELQVGSYALMDAEYLGNRSAGMQSVRLVRKDSKRGVRNVECGKKDASFASGKGD